MSRLLTALLAGYAALALGGAAVAEDQRAGSQAQPEQNQDDRAAQATVETDSPGGQAAADSDDQEELAATGADEEDTVVIIVPGDQDEQAAADADDEDILVIVVPQNQDQETSLEAEADAGAIAEGRQAAQDQESQPAQDSGQAGGPGDVQNAAVSQPDYSAELKKCDWAQGKRRAHCIEATKKQFGEM